MRLLYSEPQHEALLFLLSVVGSRRWLNMDRYTISFASELDSGMASQYEHLVITIS